MLLAAFLIMKITWELLAVNFSAILIATSIVLLPQLEIEKELERLKIRGGLCQISAILGLSAACSLLLLHF
jgi:hypothetical protein